MIVTDASVLVHFLVHSTASDSIVELISREKMLAAPVVVDTEVLNTLRRHLLLRQIDEARAADAIDNFLSLRLKRFELQPLIPRIWELRHNVTAYDAAYLALAERLGATFVSRDSKLIKASPSNITTQLV